LKDGQYSKALLADFRNAPTITAEGSWDAEAIGKYSGTEQSLDGNATGEQAGCAFHWKYTRNQIVGTHSPDAMIDCACEECNIIQG